MPTRNRWLLAIGAAILLLLPATAHAHAPGQPPFTYINDKPSPFYPLNFASLPDLGIPDDMAPEESYLINEPINFRLDDTALPLFPEEIPEYEFTWDMGDGTSYTGLELTHTYRQAGSYVITNYSRDTRTPDPAEELSTIYIAIVPHQGYELPRPVLLVNGRQAVSLYTESYSASFARPVVLDASRSRNGSTKIVSTVWDLGNRQMARDAKVRVTYDTLFSTVQPVVRLTDENGLFVDATFEIVNASLQNPDGSVPSDGSLRWREMTAPAVIGLLALGSGGWYLYSRRTSAKKPYRRAKQK
jgi:hypothetical protein